jgi:hypothetical protein
MAWPSLLPYYAQCRKILCERAKAKQKITYGELAEALGLPSLKQDWKTVLRSGFCGRSEKDGMGLTSL